MRVVIFMLCMAVSPIVWGGNIVVRPANGFDVIKSAIIQARPGDTLFIEPGVYRESDIRVDKPLVILGRGNAVIDGQMKNEIIVINSDQVTVSGLVIRNGGYSSYNDIAAIRVVNARNVRLIQNVIEHTFFGIYVQHCSDITISGNHIRSNAADELNSANGIHCWKSERLIIQHNSVSGHRDGIYFEFVTSSTIKANRCFRNIRYGLHFMFSNDDTYESNEFTDNGAGVAVMFSHHVIMRKNRFNDNWGESAYGLLLKEISDGEIVENRFERNSVGIFMEGTNRMQIKRNKFNENGWAIKLQASCDGNTIASNNFLSNSFDVATNGALVLNVFAGNYWDKYEGYDIDHNGEGDVPYRPLSIFSMIVERNPTALLLFRSFMVGLLERSEKLIPGLTPESLKDVTPKMKPLPLNL